MREVRPRCLQRDVLDEPPDVDRPTRDRERTDGSRRRIVERVATQIVELRRRHHRGIHHPGASRRLADTVEYGSTCHHRSRARRGHADLQPFRRRLTFDDAAIGTCQGAAEWVAAGTAPDGDGGGADVYLGPDDQHRVVEGPGAHAADDVDAREPGSGDVGEQHTRVGQLVRVPGDLQDRIPGSGHHPRVSRRRPGT